MVVFREGDVDVLLLTGGHSHNLLFKAGDEGAAAQLQVMVLALAALEGNAILEALKVDVGGVAHLSGAVHGFGGSNILGHAVQLGFNLLIGDGSLCLLDLQTLVLTQGDLGIDLGGQCQRNGAVVVNLHIGQVGTANGLESFLLCNGEIVDFGENLLQAVFIEDMGTVQALNHLAGSLALAEAGNHDVLTCLQVGLVDAGLHELLVDFHHNGSVIAVLFYAIDFHFFISS